MNLLQLRPSPLFCFFPRAHDAEAAAPSWCLRGAAGKGVAIHTCVSYLRAARLKDAAVSRGERLTNISVFYYVQNIEMIMSSYPLQGGVHFNRHKRQIYFLFLLCMHLFHCLGNHIRLTSNMMLLQRDSVYQLIWKCS